MTTIITEPEQFERFAVATLRGHCRLLNIGMKKKGLTKTKALKMAGNVTGKKYKMSEMDDALVDLTTWLDERSVSTPTREGGAVL